MAKLVKTFSFKNWQATRPNSPLPGIEVDDAFADVRAAVNSLDAELGDIRRADGKLNNGLVTKETLDPSLVDDLTSDFRSAIASDASSSAVNARAATAAASEARTFSDLALQDAARAQQAADLVSAAQAGALTNINASEVAATQALNDAQDLAVQISNDENHARQSANEAELWAEVSHAWAEHMPDKIPPNILAEMGISGDHWSARWWANYAAQKYGTLATFYAGAYPSHPTRMPDGSVLQAGAIYFNTADRHPYFWTGVEWTQLPSTVTIPVPIATETAIGGIYANKGQDGEFVTGIDTDGSLLYATPRGGGGTSNVVVATQTEVNAGTDASKAVTPATLRGTSLSQPSATPANDANRLVRLGANGKIDAGFLDINHLTFLGTVDVTQAPPPGPYDVGDFYIAKSAGRANTGWGLPAATDVAKHGVLLWNGSQWFHLESSVDPSAYLPLSGGTMISGAAIAFAVSSSAGLVDRLNGADAAKSAISNFTIDCGVYA